MLDVYIFLQAKGKELHRDKLKKDFEKEIRKRFLSRWKRQQMPGLGSISCWRYRAGKSDTFVGDFGTNSQKFENRQEKIQKNIRMKK